MAGTTQGLCWRWFHSPISRGRRIDCIGAVCTLVYNPEQPAGWYCSSRAETAVQTAKREQSDRILALETQIEELEEDKARYARAAMNANRTAANSSSAANAAIHIAAQARHNQPVVPPASLGAPMVVVSQESPAADVYPYNMDGHKIVFGKHKGKKYWELTGIDSAHCIDLITKSNSGGVMEQRYRQYLLDRGFPRIKAAAKHS